MAREDALEVPGLYWWPHQRPAPHRHARLASCGAEVLTMGSLRKPKRLKLLGDDEREHLLLVRASLLRVSQRVLLKVRQRLVVYLVVALMFVSVGGWYSAAALRPRR